MIYLLTAIGLPPGGSSTVHIYTQTIHRTTGNIKVHRNLSKKFEDSKYKTMLGCKQSALERLIKGKSNLTTVSLSTTQRGHVGEWRYNS
jgi:hypothetical protein